MKKIVSIRNVKDKLFDNKDETKAWSVFVHNDMSLRNVCNLTLVSKIRSKDTILISFRSWSEVNKGQIVVIWLILSKVSHNADKMQLEAKSCLLRIMMVISKKIRKNGNDKKQRREISQFCKSHRSLWDSNAGYLFLLK